MFKLGQKEALQPVSFQQVPQQGPQMPELECVALSFVEKLEQDFPETFLVHTWRMELESLQQQRMKLDQNYHQKMAHLDKHRDVEFEVIGKLYNVEYDHLIRNYLAGVAKLELRYDDERKDLQDLSDEKVSILEQERDKRIQAAQEDEPIQEDREEAIAQANDSFNEKVENLKPWFRDYRAVITEELRQKKNAYYAAHEQNLKDLKALRRERQATCTQRNVEDIQRLKATYKHDVDYLSQRTESFLKDETPESLQKGLQDMNQQSIWLGDFMKNIGERISKINSETKSLMDPMKTVHKVRPEWRQLVEMLKKYNALTFDVDALGEQMRLLELKAEQLSSLRNKVIKELRERGLPLEMTEAMEVD